MPQPHDIFIGYDDRLVYEGFAALISSRETYNVIGGAKNGEEVFKRLKFKLPKIILVELGIPNSKAIDYLRELHKEYPIPKKILISSICNNGKISKIMETGLDSFILKSCNKEDLFNALAHVEDNKQFYCSVVTSLLLKEYKGYKDQNNGLLTNREMSVLRRLVNGNSNKQIAYELEINESTVKTHRKNLMDKIGASNLLTLVRYACRNNLIDYGMDSFCLSCPYRQ